MGRIWKKASRIDSVFWFSITNRKDSVYISTIACIAWIYLGRPQTSQGQRRRRRIRMGGSIQIRYNRTRSLLVFHAPCLEDAGARTRSAFLCYACTSLPTPTWWCDDSFPTLALFVQRGRCWPQVDTEWGCIHSFIHMHSRQLYEATEAWEIQ
jgi:hypothetical protein